MKRRWAAAAAFGIILGAAGGGSARANPSVPFSNDVVDRVVIAGPQAGFRVLNDLGVAYVETEGCALQAVSLPATVAQNTCTAATTNLVTTENWDHDAVTNLYPSDKSGERQLCGQSNGRDPRIPYVDVARTMSRPGEGFSCSTIVGGQSGVVLRFIAFAKDAMSWVRYPGGAGSSVANLMFYELYDIFVSCQLTSWNQTGDQPFYPEPDPAQRIRVFTASPGTEERERWDVLVGGDSDNCIPLHLKDGDASDGERVVAASSSAAVQAAANDPDAANEGLSIYYFLASAFSTDALGRGSALLGSVDTIAPTEATIQDGSFPYSQFLYTVIRNAGPAPVASQATRRFTNASTNANDQTQGWLCKPEAAHSEPPGTPGPGVENPAAPLDYGPIVPAILRANGLVPLVPDSDGTSRRCEFTDYSVG